MNVTITPTLLKGVITPPPSKSQAHRLLLAAALAGQYGPVPGQLASEHLEALLTPPPVLVAAAPSPAPENKAASKPGKRRSRAAAKPAETAEPAPAQSAPQDAEEPAGTAEPAAPAARSRRSGASRRRKRAGKHRKGYFLRSCHYSKGSPWHQGELSALAD